MAFTRLLFCRVALVLVGPARPGPLGPTQCLHLWASGHPPNAFSVLANDVSSSWPKSVSLSMRVLLVLLVSCMFDSFSARVIVGGLKAVLSGIQAVVCPTVDWEGGAGEGGRIARSGFWWVVERLL